MPFSVYLWPKKATSCLPLNGRIQTQGEKTQLTWTVLPEGFKNSPTLLGHQPAKELETWESPPGNATWLQYAGDLLK